MQGAVNYMRGWIRLLVCGPFPERFLNLCAQRGVTFWGVEWLDGQSLRLTVLRREWKRLDELAARAGCDISVEQRAGLPAFLVRFRKRYAFLMGLSLSVLAICLLSNFVLTIEVTGNERVPDAVILSQLRRQGLRVGVYGPKLDTKQLALDTQLAVEELAWVSVNRYGTRVQVVVRERIEPPELREKGAVGDLVAGAGGLILRVDAVEGQAKVKAGDTVAPGDVLVSGTVVMEGPQYSNVPERRIFVRAAGQVWARTWRTVSAVIPLTTCVKEYTGAEYTRWSVRILERRINFYGNGSISWSDYDKISKTHSFVLPGGQKLPLSLVWEELRPWQAVQVTVDPEAARKLLEEQLTQRLNEQVGADGRVVTVDWSAHAGEGVLTVTGVAECEEQIARAAPAQNSGGANAAG